MKLCNVKKGSVEAKLVAYIRMRFNANFIEIIKRLKTTEFIERSLIQCIFILLIKNKRRLWLV